MQFKFHSSVGLSSQQADFVEAANDWNSSFQNVNSGVRFVRSDSNGWVEISLDLSVCPDWGVSSRQFNYIKICPDALMEDVAFWRRLLRHEFGHFAGYGHGNCSGNDTVMTVVQPGEMTSNTAVTVGCADAAAVSRDYTNPPELPCATDPGWPGCNSPLLIDTMGNGFRLTAAAQGVLFDVDADGDLDQVGWTAKNSDDAWLAMDRNGNGMIDDGRELFGDVTPAFPGRDDLTSPNGFEALKFLEASCYGFSLQDGVIDANDEAFGKLLLWNDRNHNGRSEPTELTPVTNSSLEAINTTYEVVERVRRENVIRQVSTVRWANGTRWIVDVWLDSIE